MEALVYPSPSASGLFLLSVVCLDQQWHSGEISSEQPLRRVAEFLGILLPQELHAMTTQRSKEIVCPEECAAAIRTGIQATPVEDAQAGVGIPGEWVATTNVAQPRVPYPPGRRLPSLFVAESPMTRMTGNPGEMTTCAKPVDNI